MSDPDFERWYQQHCDKLYWSRGQCCAGCDFWRSDAGNVGECTAGPKVSGDDVMRSAGIVSSSIKFAPGFIHTRATDHCGKFKDDFDWASLPAFYLRTIGAMFKGKLQARPQMRIQ